MASPLDIDSGQGVEFVQAETIADMRYFSGRKTPIILFHDGGGTTFTYHLLDPLGRFVYAVANPHWRSGERFEGGLEEMGRIYADYVRLAVAKPGFPAMKRPDGRKRILLGGWSLGGFLSLEVARQLAFDPAIQVTGIVMIDSPYHRRTGGSGATYSSAGFDTDEEGKTPNQILAQRAMTEARRMMPSWWIPRWEEQYAKERPRIILLRAEEPVPVKEDEGESMIDIFRGDPKLGWDEHEDDMLEMVVDIPGNHFTLAELQYVSDTSAALKRVCEHLDEPSIYG